MEKTTIETQREIENAICLYVDAVLAKSKLDEYSNGYARATGALESFVSLAVSKLTEGEAQGFLTTVRNRLEERQKEIYKNINNRVAV